MSTVTANVKGHALTLSLRFHGLGGVYEVTQDGNDPFAWHFYGGFHHQEEAAREAWDFFTGLQEYVMQVA